MVIIVPVDFSPVTKKQLSALREFVRSDSHVYLIHVTAPNPDFVGYDPGPQSVRDDLAEDLRENHRTIQGLADLLEEEGVETTPLMIQGPTVDTIMEESEKLDAGLIVVGSHGHGAAYDILVGSVSSGIIKKSRVPVLVVPSDRD